MKRYEIRLQVVALERMRADMAVKCQVGEVEEECSIHLAQEIAVAAGLTPPFSRRQKRRRGEGDRYL